ncbi:hypothetical protein CXG45_15965 [Pseudomonas plecoglossicida]|uniref:Uncharacterized protein n=1 Tax=Pseudomonas plecoglossicida TaxID=70775 RepID=A0ABX4U717_PSEDL|nr:hypothetical protein CSW00_18880 [Pseudomonas sp. MR 02]PLU86754.1 hypothetical protein CXG44_13820 [Pseudomonas plecoglossicida]PLU92120.1 hypothetical protein CXG45_15965 [Pseudomonas plecoglossicida]PLV06721.1 hypothetical protein CXG48_00540 [Pseudomonas plecoglossicida]PLV16913.1 hypothetical protein CXG47_01865 [Pseudomonas plecoglossicida]
MVWRRRSSERPWGRFAPHRDTRPLLQGNAIPCRSGLVSRWAARQPQRFQPEFTCAKGSQTLKNHHQSDENRHN